MRYGWILVFWVLQATTHLCLKFGSTHPSRWWPCFVLGNIVAVAAALALMKTYSEMDNANVALALCVGGGFLLAQSAIFVIFRTTLSAGQIFGILAITLGMTLVVMTPRKVVQSSETCLSKPVEGSTRSADQ